MASGKENKCKEFWLYLDKHTMYSVNLTYSDFDRTFTDLYQCLKDEAPPPTQLFKPKAAPGHIE